MGLKLNRIMRTLAVLVLLTCPDMTAAHAEVPPHVVVSIKPLHSLTASIMRGVGEPALLVRGSANPHSFALKPSDAQSLSAAALVVWVGPELESFLVRPLTALAARAVSLPLLQATGITRRNRRDGGVWQSDGHDHGDTGIDGHFWLDPVNAMAASRAIADALQRIDPGSAPHYQANLERLLSELQALDVELAQQLTSVQSRPFIVFHDAYQYLEARYRLSGAGSITINPERRPGARRLSELRHRISGPEVTCVFSEPQFEPALVRTLVDGTTARVGILDPEGAALTPGPDLYSALMRQNATALADCLTRTD